MQLDRRAVVTGLAAIAAAPALPALAAPSCRCAIGGPLVMADSPFRRLGEAIPSR
jgi:hypothetical protein